MASAKVHKPEVHIPARAPRLRQRHFPPRARVSLPSTKSSLRAFHRQQQQSTLTQLNFVSSSFEESEAEVSDFEEPHRTKRRRMGGKRKRADEDLLKQATLTQIGWPGEVEDSDGGMELDLCEDDVMDEQAEPVMMKDAEENVENDGANEEGDHHVGNSSVVCQGWHDTDRVSPRLRTLDAPDHTSSQAWVFRTPQKMIRHEVPSSQSPAATPLSVSADSPTKRTPLQEIPQNIWAQRDEERTPSTPSPHKPPQIEGDNDECFEEGDKENLDWTIQQSPSKQSQKRPSRSTPTPTPTPDSPAPHPDSEAMPPPPRSQHLASSPGHLTPERAHPPHRPEYDTLRSSQATTTASPTQRSRPPSPTPIRRAAAATPDPAQRRVEARPSPSQQRPHSPLHGSPRHEQPASSGSASGHGHGYGYGYGEGDAGLEMPPTPPRAFESQFPFSAFSVFSCEGMADGDEGRSREGRSSPFSGLPSSSAG